MFERRATSVCGEEALRFAGRLKWPPTPRTWFADAWPGTDSVEYRNPLVLRKYNDDSSEVRVNQGEIGSAIELSPIEKER
jgi:hypothetical protein